MKRVTTAFGIFALAGLACGQVSPGAFSPAATDDYESYGGARAPITAIFAGSVPVIPGAVDHRSVDQGDWFDFRSGGPVIAHSGIRFGVQYGFGDFTLDFTGIGGITGFSGWACAAGAGDDIIEFFDMSGAPMTGTFTKVGGFGAAGVMEQFSFVSAAPIGSVRLTGRETCFDDLGIISGAPVANALVLDWNSINGIGASGTAAAGLLPLVTTTPGDFVAELGAKAWKMVTIDNPSNGLDATTSDAIASYIAKGGRVHMSYWNLDADPTLQAAFGVASAVDFFTPRPVFANGTPHVSWGGLTSVQVGPGPSPWNDNGDTMTAAGSCEPGAPEVVGVFDSAGSGQGAIITAGAKTLVNGFDYDSMDLGTVEKLVANQIVWLVDAVPGGGGGGCYADCDGSGELDFFDFLCFQNAFAAGDCYADCDDSGSLDFFDFLCFQNEFAAGCPDGIDQFGVEAPPSSYCGERMTQFPLDPRPVFTDVTDVASPLGGQVTFSSACNVRQIGFGWASWSHGYTGSVYYTNGAASLDIGVPASSAFYLYVEPNPFADIEFEITRDAGTSVTETINGSSGAKGYGFCGGVKTVNVRTTDGFTDFAVGEFGIAN